MTTAAHPTPPHDSERRLARSEDPFVALSLLLEAVRRRERLETLVVADTDGLVVAGAGASQRCEELAATAPMSAREQGPRGTERGPDSVVQRLELRSDSLLLCAVPRAEGGPPSLSSARAGCRRILEAPR